MKLTSLVITEAYVIPDTYTGNLSFKGTYGSVTINLTADLSKAVLAAVAGCLVESSKELAEHLTAEVIAGAVPVLEAPVAAPASEDDIPF